MNLIKVQRHTIDEWWNIDTAKDLYEFNSRYFYFAEWISKQFAYTSERSVLFLRTPI